MKPKLKTIYLFRHGQTDWNKQHLVQGHSDIPLNATGIAQARQLQERFRPIPLDALYSSPLLRAYATAEIINQVTQAPLFTNEQLKEVNLGDAEGKSLQWVQTHKKELLWDISTYSPTSTFWDFAYTAGESRRAAATRIHSFLSTIPEKTIGISIHGALLRMYILYLHEIYHLPLLTDHTNTPIPIPNCALYHVTLNDTPATPIRGASHCSYRLIYPTP